MSTPRPWKVMNGAIYTQDDRPIADMVRNEEAGEAGIYPVERDENAQFIVQACNAYDELMEDLQDARTRLANDRLLASAPKLLVELEGAIEYGLNSTLDGDCNPFVEAEKLIDWINS